MQTEHKHPLWINTWEALKHLHFITAFFSWLFLLLSPLADPCTTMSAIYIVIEAGIHAMRSPTLHNAAFAVMIATPEIIVPGSFILAAQVKQQGKEARPLLTMSWLFVCLTITTLLSLFVLHFPTTVMNLIMCARCATSIGYSIIVRILTHTENPPEQTQTPPQPLQPEQLFTPALLDKLTEKLHSSLTPTLVSLVREELKTVTLTKTAPPQAHTRETPRVTVSLRRKRNTETRHTGTNHVTLLTEGNPEDRLINAYETLTRRQSRITVKTLRAQAHVRTDTARTWLKEHGTPEEQETLA